MPAAALVGFLGPWATESSLLNQLILCLMFHHSDRSSTVFITPPASYSQLLYYLHVSFVTLLIIPQHYIGASIIPFKDWYKDDSVRMWEHFYPQNQMTLRRGKKIVLVPHQ